MVDISNSFTTGTPDARDDADILPAGDHGPATGNVITGAGTTSGKAGADIAAGGHVVAVRGAGGTDASDSGASLHVEGRYGVLTLDAQGNYHYTPNQSVPDNVRDLFQYTLANKDGRDTADLVIELGGGAVKVNANAQRMVPGADGLITLPPGVDLTDVHVVGRDLVVNLPNGQQIIIVDGAVFVPQLVIGGVEVPASNVAELLIDSEVKPTAGPPQSSGGNFADPLSPLDPGTPLGDLIPPTELVFTLPDYRPIGQFINHTPETAPNPLVQLDDDALLNGIAGGVGDDPDSVNASGLLAGSGGDGSLTWALLSSGAPAGFSYVAGANGSILVQQVQGGNTVTVLTITVNASTGAYTVTQNAPILHPAGGDENNVAFNITYTVTDRDGDSAPGTLTINVDDDTPTVSVTAGPDAAVILTTHDALTIGAGSETVSTSANFSGVFSGTTVNYGADGAGVGSSSNYSLSTTGGASGLTQSGVAINLFNVSGVIVGSTATSAGAITAANTVFSVSVTATGVVTLTQFSQIDHTNADPSPTGAPFDDQFISLADGSITLTRSETATDKDGDTATGSASVAIGANLHFVDDGPAISASTTQPTLTVDESNLAANATASFAGVFTAAFGADGPAASASVTYALGINAGATGLVDTATGQAVVLSLVSGQVVGTAGAGGPVVFTVSVDASGNVTLDQVRAVVHTTSSSPDTSEAAGTIPDNLVTLTATAHDFDGDTAAATANIGSNLVFLDDGPTISASLTQPTMTVDESNLGVNATASFASVFTSSFGADGAGTIAYALGINGTATGLIDSLTGEAVVLSVVSGHVEGRTATTNQLVFTVSVAANGDVTLDQVRAVVHAVGSDPDASEAATLSLDNAVTLTATITDKDGDSASAVANIGQNLSFLDDGPSVSASATQPTLTVDESNFGNDASASFAGVFTTAFGADGPAALGATSYTLGINAGSTGLIDSLTGEAVVLSVVAGHVEGRTATTNQLVFTVSVDSAGNVTLDQSRAVIHTVGSDPDASEPATLASDNLITLTATVTDKDGDSAHATAGIGQNLSFLDDGPSVTPGGEQPVLTVDETNFAINATANFAANFNILFGADGPATPVSTTYVLGINGTATGLTDSLTGEAVVLSVNGSGQVEGRTATTDQLVFTVSVAANGDVTLHQSRAVMHSIGSDPDASEGTTLSADNAITLSAIATDKDGDSAHATINIGQNLNFLDDGPTIVASGTEATLTVDETNFAVNDTQSFASAFTANFGHDGAAAVNPTTYALGVAAGSTGLVDTLTGLPVNLYNVGGVVVGSTATSAGLISVANTVFTVSVAANGDVTLDQSRAVVHTTSSSPDTSEAAAAIPDNLITLTATVTDKDGDSAHATINIGSNLNLLDDGPTIVASGTEATLTVDETNFAVNDTQSFASAFTANFGHDGAAAVNPTTYALGVAAGSTGLVDTLTGLPVNLYNVAGVIVGSTATSAGLISVANTVFTVSVAANGDVTLDQSRAVVHTTSSSPDTSEAAAAIPDNLITLTATVTDKDGDSAHATINIGSNLNLLDDGPTAVNDSDNVGSGLTTATGNVITGVDFVGGDANATDGSADNPGHDGFGGVLQIHSNGTSTTDTTFSAGLLSVTGSYGTLTMDVNGNYTYTRAPGSPGNVQEVFTYTYQDKDGDTATANLTISITDSTPSANGISVVIDDDDVIGANGNPGGVGDLAPSNTTGTLTSLGGDGAISYFFSASQTLPSGFTSSLTTLAGVQTLQISQNGTLVITVTLTNATGAYTVVENHAIVHAAGGDENNLGVNVSFYAQDVDGSQSAPATMAITVNDDTPTVSNVAGGASVTLDETSGAIPGTAGGMTPISQTSAGAVITATQAFGADGPAATGSVVYGLSLSSGTNTVASGLATAVGDFAITLNLVDSTHITGTYNGSNVAFTITMNSDGSITVTQNVPLEHLVDGNTAAAYNDSLDLVADGSLINLVNATITITDKDGDSATGSTGIGDQIIFNDDGPSITASASADAGVTLSTQDADTIGAASDTASSTANFSGVFSNVSAGGADGAAGAATWSYALGVTTATSGLSSHGVAINLYQLANGTIVGSTALSAPTSIDSTVVFSVSVAATTGIVTLTQYQQLDHPLQAGANDAPFADQFVAMVNDHAITLTGTATVLDNDGDSASSSATIDIASNLHFDDDGPTAALSGAGVGTVTLDETRPVGSDTTGGVTPTGVASATINFSAGFVNGASVNYGADGPGSTVYSLLLTGTNVNSGLYALDATDLTTGDSDGIGQGAQIVLNQSGNTITGSVGLTNYFTITIDPATGIATFTQLNNIWNPTAGSTAAALDDAATLNTALASAIQVVQTVTDYDGDTSTAAINVGQGVFMIQDDGPTAVSAAAITTGLTNGSGSASANLDGGVGGNSVVSDNFGTDGGRVIFTAASITALTGQHYKHAGTELSYVISPDGQTLTGFIDTTPNGTVDAGETVFTIQLQTGVGGNNYTVTMNQTIDTTTTTNFTDTSFDFIGGNNGWFGIVPNGENSTPIDNDSHDLLITPMNNTSINTSGILGGVDTGQSVGPGEGFRIDYVVDLSGNPPSNYQPGQDGSAAHNNWQINTSPTDVGEQNHWYTNGAFVTMRQSTGSDINISAFNDTNNNQIVGDGTADMITKIVITFTNSLGTVFSSGDLVRTDTALHNVTLNGVIFSYQFKADGTVDVHNVQGATGANANPATTVAVYTDTEAGFVASASDPFGYDSLVINNIGGDTFKFAGFGAVTTTASPLDITVPISVIDGDGDIVSSGNLAIHANAAAVPVVLDLNGDGVQFLSSAAGVTYDYGNGSVATAWAAPDDGILVHDANHNGTVDNASEFVFGGNGVTDLQGLAAFDTNHDGQLSAADADFASFAVWQDANSNGVVDAGEMTSLTARGITSISLSTDGIAYSAAGGDVQVAGTGSFAYANGSSGALADAAFVTGARAEQARTLPAVDGNTAILAAAVAAVGLAADAAHAATSQGGAQASSTAASVAPVHNEALAPVALGATSSAQASGFVQQGTVSGHAPEAAPASSHASDQAPSSSNVSAPQSQAPTELLSGTDAPVHNAVVSATPVAAAPSVGMPAPVQSVAGDGAQAQHNAVVAQVLVDALHGGNGGTIDGLIASLPSQAGSGAGTLASVSSAGVSNGDTSIHAGFVGMHMGLGMDAMVIHQDAAPTHA